MTPSVLLQLFSMLKLLNLFLPAMLPSWRFFDVIAPSPRIQFALLESEQHTPTEWREFRPRPATLSFTQMLRRMLWNATWNELLFLMSCAERLTQNPTAHSEHEIMTRIKHELTQPGNQSLLNHATHLQFRLVYVYRHNQELQTAITYTSRKQQLWNKAQS